MRSKPKVMMIKRMTKKIIATIRLSPFSTALAVKRLKGVKGMFKESTGDKRGKRTLRHSVSRSSEDLVVTEVGEDMGGMDTTRASDETIITPDKDMDSAGMDRPEERGRLADMVTMVPVAAVAAFGLNVECRVTFELNPEVARPTSDPRNRQNEEISICSKTIFFFLQTIGFLRLKSGSFSVKIIINQKLG